MKFHETISLAACIFFFAICQLNSALGQDDDDLEKDASGLPSPHVIIDKYVQALGGYEMLESRGNIHYVSKGTNSHGSTFQYEVYQSEGKFCSRFDFDDGRVIQRGIRTDGGRTREGRRAGVAWESINGMIREMEGDEREEYLRRRSTITTATTMIESNESVECYSVEFIDDRKVYKLLFVDFEGTEIERYFDAETGLLTRRVCIEEFGSSRERVVRDYHDYVMVGEYMISKKQIVTQASGLQWIYEIELYEVDIRIPRGTLNVPKPIAETFAKANMGRQLEKEPK